jgi:hypothetical protein
MKMNPKHIKSFPKFANFVCRQLPSVMRNDKILDIIQKVAGDIPRKNIAQSFLWGQLPWVVPAVLDVDGLHTPNTDIIQINYLHVLEFQNGQDIVQVPNGKAVKFLCVVLLHELTHWADMYDRKRRGEDEEAGFLFEKLAYGGNIDSPKSLEALLAKYGEWNP